MFKPEAKNEHFKDRFSKLAGLFAPRKLTQYSSPYRMPTCLALRQISQSLANIHYSFSFGGARGVMVIVVGNGHGNTSSNPGPD